MQENTSTPNTRGILVMACSRVRKMRLKPAADLNSLPPLESLRMSLGEISAGRGIAHSSSVVQVSRAFYTRSVVKNGERLRGQPQQTPHKNVVVAVVRT
jgi:hypothetical protein